MLVGMGIRATADGHALRSDPTPVVKRFAMTEHAHAEHRLPVDEDPSQAWRAAPTMLDRFYPMDDIVAVIDDRATAEGALQALKDAGVSAADMDLVDGAWFAEAARSAVEHRGTMRRLAHAIPTDESLLTKRYLEEAEQQHVIIVVHAASDDDVTRAGAILAAHGAREMHHYARRMIRDL
jgi:hypothetical protein